MNPKEKIIQIVVSEKVNGVWYIALTDEGNIYFRLLNGQWAKEAPVTEVRENYFEVK